MNRHRASSAHSSPRQPADFITFWLIFCLCLLGIVMIFNASHIDALVQFGDKFRYAKLQSVWLIISLVCLFGVYRLPLAWFNKVSPYFLIINLVLLVLVLIPGIGSQFLGARRWLTLGNVVFQPAELAKLGFVLYLPALIGKKNFLPAYISLTALTIFLIIVEPDLGTALILSGISFGLLFLSGLNLKKLFLILAVGVFAVSLFIASSPYRVSRVKTFLNPTHDPHGTSYHVRQILIALGSGGFSGTGIGRSRQKFQYLPEATTDSIFAVMAEETGFIGGAAFMGLLAIISWRMLTQSQKITAPYPKLLAYGVSLWFTCQIMINLAAMVSLVPLTGVPLPFISYGGSALLASLLGIGLYLNASRFRAPA